jgi:hypothetical protein
MQDKAKAKAKAINFGCFSMRWRLGRRELWGDTTMMCRSLCTTSMHVAVSDTATKVSQYYSCIQTDVDTETIFPCEEDVARFQIAMHDAVPAMDEVDAFLSCSTPLHGLNIHASSQEGQGK